MTFATVMATLACTSIAPKGFLPLQDTGSITAVPRPAPMFPSPRCRAGRPRRGRDPGRPGRVGVVSVIGAGAVNPTTNVGRIVMTLQPRGERHDDAWSTG